MQVLEDLDHGQRRARQDTLRQLVSVQEADVLIHVEDVLMGQTLDVLFQGDDVLQVLVLAGVVDGVVDDDAVVERVGVCGQDGFFDGVLVDVVEGVGEAVLVADLGGPVGVDFCCGICVGEDA